MSVGTRERSALAKHSARTRWHPFEAKAWRERAKDIARVVKQAIGGYLPNSKRDLMQP